MATSLRDSKSARWTALLFLALTTFCGYYFDKVTSAVKPALVPAVQSVETWNSADFGFFKSSYGWLNLAGFLFLGGLILDKKGIRFTGLASVLVTGVGAAITWLALTMQVPVKSQIWIACIGFMIFGTGIEVVGITVTKAIAKWFKGKEIALAMGLQLATARMGTAMALVIGAPLALRYGVPTPLLVGVLLMTLAFVLYLVFCGMDRKLDASEPPAEAQGGEEGFKFSDVLLIVTNRGFWLIALLCLLFYSAVFPWIDFAVDFVVQKYHVDPRWAGIIPALLPMGNILLTPFFGSVYDKKGKGATIMAVGAVILILVHGIFAIPALDHWSVAAVTVLLLGVGFSLVPSAMWPSVPKLIPHRQLGTAYSLIFWIQNAGLSLVPFLIGWVLERFCRSVAADGTVSYDYTVPMLIFLGFGVVSLVIALLLKAEDRKKGYGLELPNRQA